MTRTMLSKAEVEAIIHERDALKQQMEDLKGMIDDAYRAGYAQGERDGYEQALGDVRRDDNQEPIGHYETL